MENDVEILTGKIPNLKGYTIIEGFPGIGLVGTISVGYLAEKVAPSKIGYISSRRFPPMASIHKGEPLFPARIYISKKRKLVLIFSEFVVPSNTVYDMAETILQWAKKNKIKRIISLAGMTSRVTELEEAQIYGIASNAKMRKEMEKKKIRLITEGVTTGVSGILMAKCNAIDFPAMSLLVEAKPGYPDPRAAAQLLEKLEEFLGFDIKTKDLIEEAEEIEGKMKSMMDQIKTGKKKYEEAEEQSPMYR